LFGAHRFALALHLFAAHPAMASRIVLASIMPARSGVLLHHLAVPPHLVMVHGAVVHPMMRASSQQADGGGGGVGIDRKTGWDRHG